MYCYVAYGLKIRSSLPLPELLPGSDSAADAVIRLGRVDERPSELDSDGNGFWATESEAWRHLAGVGGVLVRGGREITVAPVPGVDERLLRLSVLGPALALLLHQRGRFLLHASSVASSGSAVAFVGGSGWGKSTLAAALHARGCTLVADDLTVIATDERAMVFPAFPQLKLWPEAAASLGESPELMPKLHPDLDKRARRVSRGFSGDPLPLKRLYLLAEGPTPSIEPIEPREALIELLPHWYGRRFGNTFPEGPKALTAHFRRCGVLASTVPAYRLARPKRLSALADLVDFVENDLARALTEAPGDPVLSHVESVSAIAERR